MGQLWRVPGRFAAPSEGSEQRTALRFDVHGRLAGELVASSQRVDMQNFGLGGFAIEVSRPIDGGSHLVRLTTPDSTTTVFETHNVYCRPLRGAGAQRFAAGFEFVRPPQHVDRAIKTILQKVTQLRLGLRWV
jgi:hypothetical protein